MYSLLRSHINLSHFRNIKWFPVSDRVEYCIVNTVFKYWNGIVPGYIHEIFKPSIYRYSKYRVKKLIRLRAKSMVQNRPQYQKC